MLNTITIMGRLTRDIELKSTNNGSKVTSFTLAVDRDFKKGEEKQTDFIECVAFNGTAEFAAKYFSKGSMATVKGRLQIREWTDREGNKRRAAEVVADSIYFCESRRDKPVTVAYGEAPALPPSNTEFSELTDDDGDLPF